MPRRRTKKPSLHLFVTGLPVLPPAVEAWERGLIVPVLARLFDVPKPASPSALEVSDADAH